MGKHTEEYCDFCGKLLYHSEASFTIPVKRRFWWNGNAGVEDYEICNDCHWVICRVAEERRELVEQVRASLSGKSPREQMDNEPKPITFNAIVRQFKSRLAQRNVADRKPSKTSKNAKGQQELGGNNG